MSAPATMAPGAEADLQAGLLQALRANSDVQAIFGTPPRLFDAETDEAAFPFAVLERHECQPSWASGVAGQEHRITFTTASRYGGRQEAKRAVGALRAALERVTLSLPGQALVLAHVVYSDVIRTSDRRRFRGLLRVRIITEEAV